MIPFLIFYVFACAGIVYSAAIAQQGDADTISVSLDHNPDSALTTPNGEVNITAFFAEINSTLAKYDPVLLKPLSNLALQKRAGGKRGNEVLINIVKHGREVDYIGEVITGREQSHDQRFPCLFDTGSPLLIVPGSKCGEAQGCKGRNRYNERGVDTGLKTSKVFGDHAVALEGEMFIDDVTVAGLRATDTRLLSVTKVLNGDVSRGPYGFLSVMGMGFPFRNAGGEAAPTWFQNLVDQGRVREPEFSFFHGRIRTGSESKSLLTLGGREASRFEGPIYTVPVSPETGHWKIAIDGVQFAGKDVGVATVGDAIVDTGTSVMFAPVAAANAVFARVPGSYALDLDVNPGQKPRKAYVYPCWEARHISIGIGGQWLDIMPYDLNIGKIATDSQLHGFGTTLPPALVEAMNYKSYCLAAVVGSDAVDPGATSRGYYVLGFPFLKNWYTIFRTDGPTVGFAAVLK